MTKREFAVLVFRVLGIYCAISALNGASLAVAMFGMGGSMAGVLGPALSLIPFAAGLAIAGCARQLAVWSVGRDEGGTIVVDLNSGRFLILWGIGLFLLAENLPRCAQVIGSVGLSGAAGLAFGYGSDLFPTFAKTIIGLYMFRIGSGHVRHWQPPRLWQSSHPRDWGRDPNWPREETHDQT